MGLSFYDFNLQSKFNTLYENKKLLQKIQSVSSQEETPGLIKDIYGDLFFPVPPEKRPYLYASYVFSFDGKIGFSDKPLGFFISKKNLINSTGAEFDFWLLNLLRAYADMVILGGKTLCKESDTTGHVYDERLVNIRIDKLKKNRKQPICLIISASGKNIPFEHKVFKSPQIKTWIHTSPQGKNYLMHNYNCNFDIIMANNTNNLKNINCEDVPNKTIFCSGKEYSTNPISLLKVLRLIGIKRVLVEPSSYSWMLIKKELLDELFINYSGVYAGGNLSLGSNYSFSTNDHPHVKLLKLDICPPNFIYSRQKLIYGKRKEKKNDV